MSGVNRREIIKKSDATQPLMAAPIPERRCIGDFYPRWLIVSELMNVYSFKAAAALPDVE